MTHLLALGVEAATTALTVAGMGYFLAALVAARVFQHGRRGLGAGFAPGVTVLKSLKGVDPGMMEAFRSHCRQEYAGEYELLFGVSTLTDPAAAAVEELAREFPERAIRLVECPERLGTNGKVSTLAQLAKHARYDYLLINDSDITVTPRYLERVMRCFVPAGARAAKAAAAGGDAAAASDAEAVAAAMAGDAAAGDAGAAAARVGMVTALYRGRRMGRLDRGWRRWGLRRIFRPGCCSQR